MTTYLLQRGAAGYPSASADDLITMRTVIDFSQLKDWTNYATTGTYAAITPATGDVYTAILLPAGCVLKAVHMYVRQAMTGGTSPTLAIQDNASGVHIPAASIASTGVFTCTGGLWVTTGDVTKVGIPYSSANAITAVVGGTPAANGIVDLVAEVIRVPHA
jgi:hypothetical protein